MSTGPKAATSLNIQQRNAAIARAVLGGATMAECAARWKISPQRVHQIVKTLDLPQRRTLADVYTATSARAAMRKQQEPCL